MPGDQRAVRLRDVAVKGERHREGVLGGGHRVRLRALATMMPRLVAASMSTLSTPARARPITRRRSARSMEVGRRASCPTDQDRLEVPDALGQLAVGPVEAKLDLELAAQKLDPGIRDLLLDQHPGDRVGERPVGHRSGSPGHVGHVLEDPVDAGGQRLDVGGVDRWEHADAELVAAEFR